MEEDNIVENVALHYIASIEQAYIEMLSRAEAAEISESEITLARYVSGLRRVLSMISSKDLSGNEIKEIKKLQGKIREIYRGEGGISEKLEKLEEVKDKVGEIIRRHRWFDMPKAQRGFSLVDEFYGGTK
jgi:hypothetical protein